MGNEYRVKFDYQDAKLDQLLRALPYFVEFDAKRKVYYYRTKENTGTMPSAEISAERDGVYLCDYGAPLDFLGLMIVKLVSHFGSVHIEEQEL